MQSSRTDTWKRETAVRKLESSRANGWSSSISSSMSLICWIRDFFGTSELSFQCIDNSHGHSPH
jgi:hypothetical protein